MSPALLITAITAYIISLMLALMLMIISKRINEILKKKIIIFHFMLLVIYLVSFFLYKSVSGIYFMIFFCAGIATAGLILRSNSHILLKTYYTIFLLSVLVFLYSPSVLFTLLVKQKLPEKKGLEFRLKDDYYLIKQQSMLNLNTDGSYKIVKRTGKFNKTLLRDISFNHLIDSLKVLNFDPVDKIIFRGYFRTNNGFIDSLDIATDLKK